MAGLDFCSKHNMVAYLEKNDGNTEFHQIMDFLTHSSIHFALTVSPIVSTSFVEQFWTTAKSRTVNNISYIDASISLLPRNCCWTTAKSRTVNNNISQQHCCWQACDYLRGINKKPSSSIPIPDSNPEGSSGNHRGHSSSAKIKDLKAQIKQLKKKARPDYTLAQHKGKTDFKVEEPKTSSKTKELHLSGDTLVVEDKGSAEKGGSTKGTDLQQSTVKAGKGTDKQNGGTDRTKVSTDSFVEENAEIKDQVLGESDTPTILTMTSTPTPIVFGDDETIAQVLVTMSQNKVKQKEKEKEVELKNVEDIERPRPISTRSVLTLKPLPKIDPKAKAKGMIEEEDESDTESKDITEAEKKFKMLANDEEMAKKARLNADKILAENLQEEEREKFTVEERSKLLYDTIAAQRRFLAQQRYEVIRNKLPSRTQLRNQMMTYLKHVGGKKHSNLKTKFFEEIQVLYEKVKRSDENFIAIGSVEDERLIKDLNKKAAGIKNAAIIKEEIKKKKDDETNSEKGNDELRLCLTIALDEDKEVDYEIIYKNNGQRRYFSTLMRMLSIFDRDDLSAVYQLVMDRYQDEIPKGVHTLMTEAGLVIHMLVEKQYPLRKKVLMQMLELKLESKENNTMSLEFIRFVKKLIVELEPENSDGDKEDL
ncbi:hypothetical protein Tco_0548003 [Tanacetum coccineum]